MDWSVYIIIASDHSLYTGITTDIQRRWKQHCLVKSGVKGGARFFRGRSPVLLAYLESGHNRSTASVREAEIKKLSRVKKQALLRNGNNAVASMDGLLPVGFSIDEID